MLHHRTIDPAAKARHLAGEKAERVYQETGDVDSYRECFESTRLEILREFVDPDPRPEIELEPLTTKS